MSNLLLSDDEIGLLRWTCELFFVPESPVHFLDAEAHEPRDFAQTYHDLVRKGALDEASFRLTDIALNRLAPLTECDARVVLVLPGDRDRLRVRNYYLQDEIAVEYEEQDRLHVVGQDQDQGELVASLARRFMPRRSGGDYVNLKLEPQEFMALAVLCHHARRGVPAVPMDRLVEELRPVLADGKADSLAGTRRQPRDAANAGRHPPDVRHRAASLLAVPAHEPSPAQEATARSQQPVARPAEEAAAAATHVARPRTASQARILNASGGRLDEAETQLDHKVRRPSRSLESAAAEAVIQSLLDKGVARQGTAGVELRPAVAAFAVGLTERARHTFVRFDFADDEWFIRETSFLSVEGSLYVLAAEDGLLNLVELDGRRLEAWLAKAVGPLPELHPDSSPGRSAKDFLLRG